MGIFDFLSDLSKSGKNDLGLGGLKSLLGTRGAAPMGSRGDEMMSKTSEDSLPGYFDPNTREYVPWYVDLFNGGGLNSSEGLLAAPTAEMPAADAGLLGGGRVQRGAGVRPQVRPSSLDQLDPFGGAGPNIPENPLGPFGGSGPQVASPAPDFQYDYPTNFPPSNPNNNLSDMERLNRMPGVDPRNMGGASSYGQTGISPMQNNPTSDPQYQRFVQDLIEIGGFERELQDPEWLMRTFEVGKAKGRL